MFPERARRSRGLTGGADLQAEPNRSPSKIEDKKKADLWRKAGRKVGGDEGVGGPMPMQGSVFIRGRL